MKKVLMIVTSHKSLGTTDQKTGLWLEELAAPYFAFQKAGFEVTLASPLGGEAPFDPKSLGDPSGEAKAFLADAEALGKAKATQRLSAIEERFDAYFVVGGHGVMWDLPDEPALKKLLAGAFDAGKVVAAVCHGPAALVNVVLSDGKPLVAGRKVTGFSDAEEKAVRLDGVVPFALESRLRSLGGVFESAGLWQSHAVRDGRLVTGQNPASSAAAAREVVAALG